MARKSVRELEEENSTLKQQLNAVADVLDDEQLADKVKLDEIENVIFDDEQDQDEETEQ